MRLAQWTVMQPGSKSPKQVFVNTMACAFLLVRAVQFSVVMKECNVSCYVVWENEGG